MLLKNKSWCPELIFSNNSIDMTYWEKSIPKNPVAGKFFDPLPVSFWNSGLIGACISGNYEMTQYLIDKGADNLGEALEYCAKGRNIEIVILLLKKVNTDMNSVMKLVKSSIISEWNQCALLIMSQIIKHKQSYNNGDISKYLRLSLGWATAVSNMPIIEFLICSGCDYVFEISFKAYNMNLYDMCYYLLTCWYKCYSPIAQIKLTHESKIDIKSSFEKIIKLKNDKPFGIVGQLIRNIAKTHKISVIT
jgi:hypothetical protein